MNLFNIDDPTTFLNDDEIDALKSLFDDRDNSQVLLSSESTNPSLNSTNSGDFFSHKNSSGEQFLTNSFEHSQIEASLTLERDFDYNSTGHIQNDSKKIQKLTQSSKLKEDQGETLVIYKGSSVASSEVSHSKKKRGTVISKAERAMRNRASAKNSREKKVRELQELETLYSDLAKQKTDLIAKKERMQTDFDTLMRTYNTVIENFQNLQQI